MEVVIGDLEVNDLTTCFLDTLSSLAEVRLTPAEAAEILSERRRALMKRCHSWTCDSDRPTRSEGPSLPEPGPGAIVKSW